MFSEKVMAEFMVKDPEVKKRLLNGDWDLKYGEKPYRAPRYRKRTMRRLVCEVATRLCPFCGSGDVESRELFEGGHAVECRSCYAQGPVVTKNMKRPLDAAARKWNKRHV
jgi:hypothetical protein